MVDENNITNATESAQEAAKALFFLQTSPVITSLKAEDLKNNRNSMPSFTMGNSSTNNNSNKMVTRSLRSSTAKKATESQAGPALAALLNLKRLISAANDNSLMSDDLSSNGSTSSPEHPGSMSSLGLSDEGMDIETKRERSLSVAVVEKRFSSDAMSIRQSQGKVGAYTRDERKKLIDRFLRKRENRIWRKRVKYDVRKNFADSRLRVKGRFVRKEDEEQLREFLIMTF